MPDRWILSRLNAAVSEVGRAFEEYRFDDAALKIYDFIWSEYCDWYVEISKTALGRDDDERAGVTASVLVHVLETAMRLLHPLMPYVTEEVWQNLWGVCEQERSVESIMISPYPAPADRWTDNAAEREMASLIDLVRSIRNVRADLGHPARERIRATLLGPPGTVSSQDMEWVQRLSRSELSREDSSSDRGRQLARERHVTARLDAEHTLVFPDADVNKEIERLRREIEAAESEIKRAEGKLSNTRFTERAPPDVVGSERRKLSEWTSRRDAAHDRLETMTGQG